MIMKGSRNSQTLKAMLADEEQENKDNQVVINFDLSNKELKNRLGKDGK